MHGPRFNRIVPLITLVLAGLGVVFLLELNTELLIVNPGENLPSFSVAWPLIGVLALLTGLGVELVAHAQPHLPASGWMTTLTVGQRRIELALPLWSIPMLTPIAVFAFFRLFRGVLATNAYLLVLVATFGLLLTVLTAQHFLIEGTASGRRTARSALSITAYALAFAIFSAVSFNRYRTLFAVALIAPTVLLLASDLLRGYVLALWTTASAITLVMIESYWALNSWSTPFLINGVALLVIFYLMIGLAQSVGEAGAQGDGATGGLTRRAIVEYGLVGAIALIALVIATVVLRAQNIELRVP